jgi:DNA-binding NtrC family response regulator
LVRKSELANPWSPWRTSSVDDHREIRDLLAKYLAKHGFRVSAAESAAKARRLLEASGSIWWFSTS